MLDGNLYTLNFIRSANDTKKLVIIEEGSGEIIYYRLRSDGEDQDSRIDLYHSLTNASLGSLQDLTNKIRLISLENPTVPIEIRNTSCIHWEWSFDFFDHRFSWRRDILSLSSQKRGLTCWMVRKPDPDYPCAIYRPSLSSSSPARCQILDFNIQRIEGIEDRRGLEIVIILSLLGFIDHLPDQEARKLIQSNVTKPKPPLPSTSSRPIIDSPLDLTSIGDTEPNEILVSEGKPIDDYVNLGLKLLSDPLLLYIYIHARSPNTYPIAVKVAESIKRTRWKRSSEDLKQYVVDDLMSRNLKGKKGSGRDPQDERKKSKSLKIYLSRTTLDELLPPSSSTTTRKSEF